MTAIPDWWSNVLWTRQFQLTWDMASLVMPVLVTAERLVIRCSMNRTVSTHMRHGNAVDGGVGDWDERLVMFYEPDSFNLMRHGVCGDSSIGDCDNRLMIKCSMNLTVSTHMRHCITGDSSVDSWWLWWEAGDQMFYEPESFNSQETWHPWWQWHWQLVTVVRGWWSSVLWTGQF